VDALRRLRSSGAHATFHVAALHAPSSLKAPAPGDVRVPLMLGCHRTCIRPGRPVGPSWPPAPTPHRTRLARPAPSSPCVPRATLRETSRRRRPTPAVPPSSRRELSAGSSRPRPRPSAKFPRAGGARGGVPGWSPELAEVLLAGPAAYRRSWGQVDVGPRGFRPIRNLTGEKGEVSGCSRCC
jgi:hypothetical protein